MAGRVAPIQQRYVNSASSDNTPDPSANHYYLTAWKDEAQFWSRAAKSRAQKSWGY